MSFNNVITLKYVEYEFKLQLLYRPMPTGNKVFTVLNIILIDELVDNQMNIVHLNCGLSGLKINWTR